MLSEILFSNFEKKLTNLNAQANKNSGPSAPVDDSQIKALEARVTALENEL